MSQWVVSGLRTGIRTTRYPFAPERTAGVSPGIPAGGPLEDLDVEPLAARCPTGALLARNGRIEFDARRCVHCFRCVRGTPTPLPWHPGHEWARVQPGAVRPLERDGPLGRAFAHSLHIRVVDAGDCGACLHEVKQLGNPYYNLHRLGFFITPTPRQADILLVVGAGTESMRHALVKAYEAMPTPRSVLAVGTCALTGGVLGRSFACSAGIGSLLPVDVEVPGQPPPPLAILHALLVVTGRASTAPRTAKDAAS